MGLQDDVGVGDEAERKPLGETYGGQAVIEA